MHSNQFRRTRVAAAVAGLALALGAGQAFGAAFALQEQSVSGLGNAYAGGAAAAEDASTVFSNPAGMSRFAHARRSSRGLNIITPSIKFNNNGGSLHAFNQPLGGTGGDAGSTNYVPNLYLVVPINKQFAVRPGRRRAVRPRHRMGRRLARPLPGASSPTSRRSTSIAALSWQATDNFSVGVGVDYQQIKATFTSNVNYSGALATGAQQAAAGGLIPPSAVRPVHPVHAGLDSFANIDGDDSAWGWDIGALWDITPDMRVGAHYRSSIKYNVSGNASFTNPALPPLGPLAPIGAAISTAVNAHALYNSGVTSSIELPSITNVSFFAPPRPQVGRDGRHPVHGTGRRSRT